MAAVPVDAEVIAFQHLEIRTAESELVGRGENPFYQNAGEQEKRGDNDPGEAEARGELEAFGGERFRGAGITNERSAKTEAFLEHPGEFRNIGVCIRIGGAAAYDD